ncbi:penicillin-insensitive murein endopeptidase [Vibrio sp. Of7-15]|uniref:penicillin-insensitive murein endopeptidase n=1 Tax=Vibrio sp. Of7-15 TaxID=2724879 RepID=UPI001EF3D3A7|nr:penicillin-insensitive murein endopeptidase [Vibrio sp. Of7-15]MCG7499712.1 penicillin-insensitive murein endopeptidase [Vibrio sp. Of7-15]
MKAMLLVLSFVPFSLNAAQSTCYGTTSNGRLEQGVQLPVDGENFTHYSYLARFAGRTYVHSTVKEIMMNAYQVLETEQPDKVYKYAETGFEEGERFRPHKTHRNGLSVDFMTPVINESGQSVHLPTHPFNKFGYNIEFDEKGQYDDLRIDYVAMAAHIVQLHKQSKAMGYDLWRVIFDPKLQPHLFTTEYGEYLKKNVQFSKKRSWVRHDEHYHVDFLIPCEP